MTWTVAEDFPEKVKKAVIVNVPHLSVFGAAVRSSFRQIRRSWYIGTCFAFSSFHSCVNTFSLTAVCTLVVLTQSLSRFLFFLLSSLPVKLACVDICI